MQKEKWLANKPKIRDDRPEADATKECGVTNYIPKPAINPKYTV